MSRRLPLFVLSLALIPAAARADELVLAGGSVVRGPVLKLPNMGAGLPINVIDRVLGSPIVIVPIANHDNNQHTHNENLRLQNLWDGIETIAALMGMK